MIKLNTLVNDILNEEMIKLYPDWNSLQVDVFKDLQSKGMDQKKIVDEMPTIGKILRQYMDDNFGGAGWDTGNVDRDTLRDELVKTLLLSFGELEVRQKFG